MPRLDGIAVCERLKTHPTRRLIPVAILTAARDYETRLRGIAAGADDFLSKPFDRKELLIRTKILPHDRARNLRLDATEGVLVALARAVDAMVSDRPYRAGLGRDEATARMRSGSGKQFDAELAWIFLELAEGGLVDRVTDAQLAQAR